MNNLKHRQFALGFLDLLDAAGFWQNAATTRSPEHEILIFLYFKHPTNQSKTTLAPIPQGTMFGGSAVYRGRRYCFGGSATFTGNTWLTH